MDERIQKAHRDFVHCYSDLTCSKTLQVMKYMRNKNAEKCIADYEGTYIGISLHTYPTMLHSIPGD